MDSQPGQSAGLSSRWAVRVAALAGALALESVAVAAVPHPGCSIHQGMIAAIAFSGALLVFGRKGLSAWAEQLPGIDRAWLGVHAVAWALLFGAHLLLMRVPEDPPLFARVSWFAALALAAVSIVAAFLPLPQLARKTASLGAAPLYAAVIALGALFGGRLAQMAWAAPHSRFGALLQAETFRGTRALLGLFYSDTVSHPATVELGTARFQVEIAGPCSGMEGLALMTVLSVGWLAFARRELRMARAVWLVPVSLVAVWLLNIVRIAALIAIGDAGHPAIAVGGFHSEAGWILFNAVALSFLLAANRVAWLRKDTLVAVSAASERNPAAIYLMPFLAILAASLLTQAASNGFEWLYPLRLVAALAALWAYRREYKEVDWRFGWLGPAAGAAVFAIWLLAARLLPNSGASPGAGLALAAGLAQLSPWQRTLWLVARVAAAVITVPIAEELAFRGYVARRLTSEDVEGVGYRRLGFAGIAVSSVLFGAMHGHLWLVGIVAGVAFALVARVRGRLGEAVAAHASANLLLAVWVLSRGDYGLW